MRKLLKRIAILAIMTFPAAADMGSMFNTYVNATPPRSTESATRVGHTFGNATVRYNLSREPVAAFSPPSIRSGCGGIDFYAGGFSVINGDQLAQMGRAIIQGAPTYAFNLGLTSVCPSCSSIMGDLQSMLNNVNQFAQNACQSSGQWLYENAGIKPMMTNAGNATTSMLGGIASEVGAAADFMDGYVNPEPDLEKRAADAGITLSGNATWELVKASRVLDSETALADFYGVSYAEFIMSLMGTTVSSPADPESGETSLEYTPYAPTLTLLDVIAAPSKGYSGSPASPSSPKVIQLLTCEQADVDCLNPVIKEVNDTGLMGVMSKTYTNIIMKIKDNQTLTASELLYVRVSGINIPSVAASIPDAATAGKIVAAYSAAAIVRDLLAGVHRTLSSLNALESSPQQQQLLKDGEAHAQKLRDSIPHVSDLINKELASARDAVGLAASLNELITRAQYIPAGGS